MKKRYLFLLLITVLLIMSAATSTNPFVINSDGSISFWVSNVSYNPDASFSQFESGSQTMDTLVQEVNNLKAELDRINASLNSDLDSIVNDVVPIGTIQAYSGSKVYFENNLKDKGWEICDGREIDSSYVELKDVLDSAGWANNVYPDLRGMFLRGFGTYQNTTIYSGEGKVGVMQYDTFQGHGHTIVHKQNWGNGGKERSAFGGDTSDTTVTDPVTTNVEKYGEVRTGNETRPANITVLYIIKAW